MPHSVKTYPFYCLCAGACIAIVVLVVWLGGDPTVTAIVLVGVLLGCPIVIAAIKQKAMMSELYKTSTPATTPAQSWDPIMRTGNKAQGNQTTCAHCGMQLPENDKSTFCPACGTRL